MFPNCLDLGYGGIGGQCGQEGVTCAIPNACCAGLAICQGGTWTAQPAACGQPCIPCGEGALTFGCSVDSVCVIDQLGFGGTTYQCFEDPCLDEPLGCVCADKLCAQNFLSCVGPKDASTLLCDCPNC
jgi:hypothetical protein